MHLNLDKLTIDELHKMIDSSFNNNNYEFEVRFGMFENKYFIPSLKYNIFKNILEDLYSNNNFENSDVFEILSISNNTVDNNKLYKCAKDINSIKKICSNERYIDSNVYFVTKTKKINICNVENYDIRFELSEESDVKPTEQEKEDLYNCSEKCYRYKKRYSFIRNNGLFRIDLSMTKTSPNYDDYKNGIIGFSNFNASNVLDKNINYECEIEYLPNSDLSIFKDIDENNTKAQKELVFNELVNNIYYILKHIQECEYPIPKDFQETVFHNYINSFLVNNNSNNSNNSNDIDYFNLPKTKKNFFLGADTCILKSENLIDYDNNINKFINDNVPNDYAITLKADGERSLLYVDHNGYVYIMNNRIKFKDTGIKIVNTLKNTLVDGEYLSETNKFLAFDLIYFNGNDYRNRILNRTKNEKDEKIYDTSRLEQLKKIIETFNYHKKNFSQNKKSTFTLLLKHYEFPKLNKKNIFEVASNMWNNKSDNDFNVDGLIFTPRREEYHNVVKGFRWRNQLKWKPLEMTSIDFLVNISQTNNIDVVKPFRVFDKLTNNYIIKDYKTIYLKVGQKSGKRYLPTLFRPSEGSELRKTDCFIAKIFCDTDGKIYAYDPSTNIKEEIQNNSIVEFTYNKENNVGFEWVPIRIRHDKTELFKNTRSISNTANDINIATSTWKLIHEIDGLLLDNNIFELINDKFYYNKILNFVSDKEQGYYNVENNLFEGLTEEEKMIKRKDMAGNLRLFNNITKYYLYENISNLYKNNTGINDLRLLDLGSGRGGDLSKYIKSEIKKVTAVDLDKVNITQMNKRYMEMDEINKKNLKLEIFHGDFSKLLNNGDSSKNVNAKSRDDLISKYEQEGFYNYNLVSSQFSIHYAFKDEISVRGFIHNVFNNLRIGGYFFGTTFDGKVIFDKLKNNNEIIGSYNENESNILYKIEKKYDNKDFLKYGQKIDFTFKNISSEPISEYLVNFDYLVNVLKEDYDMVLLDNIELKSIGLEKSIDSFEYLYNKSDNENKSFKLQDVEKDLVFKYHYFVFKKVGTGNAKEIQKWNKLITLK